jgi:hypothetical protein
MTRRRKSLIARMRTMRTTARKGGDVRQRWPKDQNDESRVADFNMDEETFGILVERLPDTSG